MLAIAGGIILGVIGLYVLILLFSGALGLVGLLLDRSCRRSYQREADELEARKTTSDKRTA